MSQVDGSTTQGRSASSALPAHMVLHGQNAEEGSSLANNIPNRGGNVNGERIIYDLTDIGSPTLSAIPTDASVVPGAPRLRGPNANGGIGQPTTNNIPNRGGNVNGAKFSIGGLYTGSAADYEKPSLLKVGTGEGSQVYGWGLYASDKRGVAENYADAGAARNHPINGVYDYFVDGKKTNTGSADYGIGFVIAARELARGKSLGVLKKELLKNSDNENAKAAYDFLNKHELKVQKRPDAPNRILYEQTFFTNRAPGDESHLLKWYEPVGEEMLNRLLTEITPEFIASRKRMGMWTPDSMNNASVVRQNLFRNKNQITGEDIYYGITKVLGSPKSASEWLAAHGIDGIKYPVDSYGTTVKDGDKAGWNYVSFRDDNIRVDHKWRDGQAVFHVGKAVGPSKLGDGQQRFSVRVSPTLHEDVRKALNTDRTNGEIVKGEKRVVFCRTPKVLQSVGLDDADIYSKAYVLRKVSKEHGVTAEQIIKMPELITSPAAVFDDYGKGYVVITTAQTPDEDGVLAPLAIIIRPDKEGNYIASAYSRKETSEAKYIGFVRDGKTLYYDKNKVVDLALRGEAQSSLSTFSIDDDVLTPEKVNARSIPYFSPESQSQIDTPAFKAWFGKSKIVDGQPWTPPITVKSGSSAFYSIGVGK